MDEWTAANIDAALEPLPEQMDLKKRVVFQAVRVAVCGNMVSPPLGETMALVGRDDCLARIDRAPHDGAVVAAQTFVSEPRSSPSGALVSVPMSGLLGQNNQ